MNFNCCIQRPLEPTNAKQRTAFDSLLKKTLARGPNATISYDLPYTKSAFLHYLCDERGYYAHGSHLPDLQVLKPVRHSADVSEFGNRQQVFAAGDAVWAMWFAILYKEQSGGTINGCFTLGKKNSARERFYYFAVAAEALRKETLFQSGTVYLAPAQSFPHAHALPFDPPAPYTSIQFEEYGSNDPIVPIAHLHIEPEDFPYLKQVYGYDPKKLSERLQTDMDNMPWLEDEEVYPHRPGT